MKTNTETRFKQTEIGEIPEDWEVVRLGENGVSKIIMGQSPKSVSYNNQKIGLPFYQGKSDFGLKNPMPKIWCSSPIKIAEKNDILLSVRAPVGDVNLANEKCCIGRGITAIRTESRCFFEFLYYCILYFKSRLESLGTGAIFKAINKEILFNFLIPLPSLEEQKKIAGVLSKIQEAVENQRKIIEKLEELKKSTMDKLFTKGLYGKETKQTEIGEIPEDWEVVRLGDVCDTTSGGTPYRNISKYFCGNIPWVKSGELKDYDILETEEKISEEGLKNSSAKILERGTVLVAMYGATVGKTGILAIKAATNQAICAIFPKKLDTIFNKFIQYFLIKNRNFLIRERYGGAQPNISQQVIKNLNIPLPPLSEQKKIAEILSKIDKMKEEAEKKLDYLNEFFNSALNLLITGKVRLR